MEQAGLLAISSVRRLKVRRDVVLDEKRAVGDSVRDSVGLSQTYK